MSDNSRGALLMIASMSAFTFGDLCVKGLGGHLPLSQILTIRGLVATTFILLLAWRMGALRWQIPRRDAGLVALRAVAEIGAALFFFYALFNMPIANVSALLQMLPLTITLGSALFFREPVGWRRWLAIGVGFCGMLLIVRPGTEGFNIFSLSALASVACVTVRDLTTRRISAAVPSLTVTLGSSAGVMLFAAVWSLFQDWQPIEPRSGMLLAGASLFIIGGYIFSVLVMRVGEVGFVAPFRYTSLVLALLLGYVFFGEWPKPIALTGAAIIMATGLFTLWREMQLKRRQAKARRT
ncbi:DMT family transporter [Thetidibacter halocola]|uniref:DMT family transporter n=1 Tax=Thetidibacter halocola TaxID=2827239 RepID=A0A8J7WED6_9RHOB|nr:DMT family transporter [Thetidibacter halocola]MBS0123848.1 DMT family transporter [Thetidibacter halocola]